MKDGFTVFCNSVCVPVKKAKTVFAPAFDATKRYNRNRCEIEFEIIPLCNTVHVFWKEKWYLNFFLANLLESERFVFCFTQNGEYSLCSLILHCETSSDLLQKAGTTQNGSAKVLRKAYVARSKYTDKYAYTLFATLSEPRHKRLGQHRTVYVTRATLLSSDV